MVELRTWGTMTEPCMREGIARDSPQCRAQVRKLLCGNVRRRSGRFPARPSLREVVAEFLKATSGTAGGEIYGSRCYWYVDA